MKENNEGRFDMKCIIRYGFTATLIYVLIIASLILTACGGGGGEGGSSTTEPTGGPVPPPVYFLRLIPSGCFQMGDASLEAGPVHQVCLSSYYIDLFEVTQEAYQAVMGTNPSSFKGDKNPVENVTWVNANDFCKKRGRRLPTEAEWEYAARSGGKNEKYAGTSDDALLGNYAWYGSNSGGTTHPVRTKLPNGFELSDMSGNVEEWVADWYGPYTSGAQDNPTGPNTGSYRVIRGGSWSNDDKTTLRTSLRAMMDPNAATETRGFRCADTALTSTCTYTLSQTSNATVPETGGSFTFSVVASGTSGTSNCIAWKATTPEAWITIQADGSGIRNGTVSYTVAANTDLARRAGSITVAGQTFTITQVGTPPAMVSVPGGCFQMGNTFGGYHLYWETELPVHQVCLSSYSIDVTEVTQRAYQAVMGTNPSWYSNLIVDNNPVENVTWFSANEYCTKVGKRLPTEAEWEYAARSGGKNEKYAGTSDYALLGNYAWYEGEWGTPHPVGTKLPNGLGLYDMSGNVWEWVADWYGPYTSGAQNNPTGPNTGSYRVMRGGALSLYNGEPDVRAARRRADNPKSADFQTGFRCARTP
jgi:formylglycine-generating enzyme